MKFLRVVAVVLVLMVGISFIGCGGGKTSVKQSSTTIGQELIDLEKAYNDKIITKKQYEEQKKKILKRKQ